MPQHEKNSDALSEDAAPASVPFPASFPDDWIPEGAGVWVVARRHPGDRCWEVLIPEFSIASQGGSLHDATKSALELLIDYLMMCARDGLRFQEAYRPVDSRLRLSLLAGGLAALVLAKTRRKSKPRDRSYLRLPIAAH